MIDAEAAHLPVRPAALLVRGGTVCTADPVAPVHSPGSVLVVGDRVRQVGGVEEVDRAVAALPPEVREGTRTVDARSMMVLPGFVNAHWHEMFAMRLPFKGALRDPDDRGDEAGFMACGGDIPRISTTFDSFHELMRALTPGEARAIARYSLWTQLRCGTTTIGDVGSFNLPEALADAVRGLGMRGMLSTWASDAVCAPGESRRRRTRNAAGLLADIGDLLERYSSDSGGRLRAWPTAVYPSNMTDSLGAGLAELAVRHDTAFATHVGSLRNEAESTRAYYGTSPLRRLGDLGLLSDRLVAVHCGYADDEERKLLLENRVHVSHSPAKYGSTGESTLTGTGLITGLIREGLDVSVSTDGSVYPVGGMAESMRAAWQTHNEMAGDNTLVLPSDALAMATLVPARGLRWDSQIGSLREGKQADLLLIPADDWRYLLNPRPLEAFLHLGGSCDIDTVVVAGRTLVEHGRPTFFDETELRDDYLRALRSFSGRALGIGGAVLDGVLGHHTASPAGGAS